MIVSSKKEGVSCNSLISFLVVSYCTVKVTFRSPTSLYVQTPNWLILNTTPESISKPNVMVGDELSLIVNLPADVSRILKNPLPALHSEEAGASVQRGMLGSSAIISTDLLVALQLTPSVVLVAPLALTVVTPLISGLSATYVPYGRASPEAYAPTAEPADAD